MRGSRQRWSHHTKAYYISTLHLLMSMYWMCLSVSLSLFYQQQDPLVPPSCYSGQAGVSPLSETWNTCLSFLSSTTTRLVKRSMLFIQCADLWVTLVADSLVESVPNQIFWQNDNNIPDVTLSTLYFSMTLSRWPVAWTWLYPKSGQIWCMQSRVMAGMIRKLCGM